MQEVTKGKTVGCWLSREAAAALQRALGDLKANGREVREGTYGAEAIYQRLEREGYLADSRASDVVAQAAELVHELGPEVVQAKLGELAVLRVKQETPQAVNA